MSVTKLPTDAFQHHRRRKNSKLAKFRRNSRPSLSGKSTRSSDVRNSRRTVLHTIRQEEPLLYKESSEFKLEVMTAMKIWIVVVWVMTPCSLVSGYNNSEDLLFLHAT